MLRYQCHHHLLRILKFLCLSRPLLVPFDHISTLTAMSNFLLAQSFSSFSDINFSLIFDTLTSDGFCLLMLLSVFAVTSKGTNDDTYSRCPMIKSFLIVLSWLLSMITGTRKYFLIPSFNKATLSAQ